METYTVVFVVVLKEKAKPERLRSRAFFGAYLAGSVEPSPYGATSTETLCIFSLTYVLLREPSWKPLSMRVLTNLSPLSGKDFSDLVLHEPSLEQTLHSLFAPFALYIYYAEKCK